MLEIPEKVRPMVSDYKMNLLQLRASETCDFQDPEVAAVFDISRSIYGDLEGSDRASSKGYIVRWVEDNI